MVKSVKVAIDRRIDRENLNDYSVNEIEEWIKNIVEEFLPKEFEENCTVRYFRKMFIILSLRKKFLSYAESFKDMDEKNVCIFFLENYLSELLSNISQHAKIFKREEEDRTNRKHISQRRKIMLYVGKIREIVILTQYSFNKSSDNHTAYYNKKN